MTSAAPDGSSRRSRSSAFIAVVGAALVGAVGLRIYLADGSFFHGEASVVLSFEGLSILETFQGNLLGGGQSFPRAYLLAIRVVRMVLGDYTWATRLLPQAFFLAATVLWCRLLYLRFRSSPPVVLLGVVLLIATVTWPIYGAAVKQYTFDVFWVMVLFSVPDRVLDTSLRSGRRRLSLLMLVVPVAFSYTYGIALLARWLGWYAYSWRRDGFHLDHRSTALAIASFGTFAGVLWLTDIRHTLGQDSLFIFWEKCILPLPPRESLALLDRFVLGWYEGRVEFVGVRELPLAIRVALHLAFALGVARMVSTIAPRTLGSEIALDWGSRSVGALAGVSGAIASSFVLDYPICSGRLLLYTVWFQHMLILEGIDFVLAAARRAGGESGRRRSAYHGTALIGSLAVTVTLGFTAFHLHRDLLARAPIEDVRPQLEKLATAPELPVVVTRCMDYQIQTLPEGLGMEEVIVRPFAGGGEPLPLGQEVWIIHSLLFPGMCQLEHQHFMALTSDATPKGKSLAGEKVIVYRTRLLTREEAAVKAERVHQESVRRRLDRKRRRDAASD